MSKLRSNFGGCMCGEIRYEVHGEPAGAGYCHCRSCRHHTGAPVVAFAVFRPEQVSWLSGKRAKFASSAGTFRAFCAQCGTSLTWEGNHSGARWVEIHIGTLDDPAIFPPNEHTHCAEQIPWLSIADDLEKFERSMS